MPQPGIGSLDCVATPQGCQRFRAAETDAFTANSRAVMAHFLDHGLVDLGPVGKWAWRGVGQLADLLGRRQLTPFWADPAPAAA